MYICRYIYIYTYICAYVHVNIYAYMRFAQGSVIRSGWRLFCAFFWGGPFLFRLGGGLQTHGSASGLKGFGVVELLGFFEF